MAEKSYARALYDYDARSSEELSLKAGCIIQLSTFSQGAIFYLHDEWWEGECNGASGLFPANYVEQIEAPLQRKVSSQKQEVKSVSGAQSASQVTTKTASLSVVKSQKPPEDPEPGQSAKSADADEIEELENENALLRKSAESLVHKVKELKQHEAEMTKKLSDALAREEKLMDEINTLKSQSKPSNDDLEDEIAKLEDENALLKESATKLVEKLQAMKTELAEVKQADESKDAKISALEKEVAALKAENAELKRAKTETSSPPPAATPATQKAASTFAAALMKRDTSQPTPSSPNTAPSSSGNKFAALVRAASGKSGLTAAPSSSPSTPSSTSKWGAALSGAVQTVRSSAAGPLQLDESVLNAYNTIRSDPPTITWALFSYDADGRKISATQTGSGGIASFTSLLKPEDRAYGFVRVTTGDSMSARAKFIFITWVGDRVPPLKKARVSTDRMFVKETIREFAVEVFANSLDELSEQTLMTAVKKAGGADYGSSTN